MKTTIRNLDTIGTIINARPKSGDTVKLAWGWKLNRYGHTYVVFNDQQTEPFRAFRYVYYELGNITVSVVERPGWIARIRTTCPEHDAAVLNIIAAQIRELREGGANNVY